MKNAFPPYIGKYFIFFPTREQQGPRKLHSSKQLFLLDFSSEYPFALVSRKLSSQFFVTGILPICPRVQDICAWKEFARLKPEWSLLRDLYIGNTGQRSSIIPFYRMRVISWLPSNSLIDWFYSSVDNVRCNFWAVFLISHGHRLVIFILQFHFLCLEATVLGMCYITKQLRNRIPQTKPHLLHLLLGAFVMCGWDTHSGFLSAAVIQQPHMTTVPACQGLRANAGIIFSTLILTFCPSLIIVWYVNDNPDFFRTCYRKDTTFLYTSTTFLLQCSQVSAAK